ncbi:MAG: hypothetical protein U9R25_20015 [Chloroflexota bacterium]|nr:hypothetical protein [Chloroflexota bacterium]
MSITAAGGNRGEVGPIKVVGPCKSGKTSLVAALLGLGFQARGCSQEHSQVPDMWRRIAPPRWLIFLDVSTQVMRERSARDDWTDDILAVQQARLRNARGHAHLYIHTDGLNASQVLEQVLAFFASRE